MRYTSPTAEAPKLTQDRDNSSSHPEQERAHDNPPELDNDTSPRESAGPAANWSNVMQQSVRMDRRAATELSNVAQPGSHQRPTPSRDCGSRCSRCTPLPALPHGFHPTPPAPMCRLTLARPCPAAARPRPLARRPRVAALAVVVDARRAGLPRDDHVPRQPRRPRRPPRRRAATDPPAPGPGTPPPGRPPPPPTMRRTRGESGRGGRGRRAGPAPPHDGGEGEACRPPRAIGG
jgi:hypothetical protein